MPIEMPKGLPFSVDTGTSCSKLKRHHFLTHAHKDHAQGICVHSSYPIYSTLLTRTLLLRYFSQLDESIFIGIEVGQSLVVEDPDGDFIVTAFDANHCPGAVMFLFEGHFGNILHTGDCRLTPECLQSLPDKYIGKKGKDPRCPLDYIFLDCTFGQFLLKMPSKSTAIQQVIDCIWKHPDAPTVYLTCDLLGQEEILIEVSQTFGGKIYVDKLKNLECFKSLEVLAPKIMSADPCSRFQLFDGFPRLYERAEAKIAEARAGFQHEPLILRPSAQWYACDESFPKTSKRSKERFDQATRDPFGVWYVCYSIHSSKDELECALHLLSPRWVVSTTPSCRALELDYVKKHCFNSRQAFGGTLWKLMDINEDFSDPDVQIRNLSWTNEEHVSNSCVEKQPEAVVLYTNQRKQLSLSPPKKRPMVTLFGRARLGLLDSTFPDEPEIASTSSNCIEKATNERRGPVIEVKAEELLETKKIADIDERESSPEPVKEHMHNQAAIRPTGLSSNCNKNLKRSYGPTNLPVPSMNESGDEVIEINAKRPSETKKITELVERESSSIAVKEWTYKQAAVSPIGLPSYYKENLRKFYRSMNVPVPEPLPSRRKLMNTRQSSKKRMLFITFLDRLSSSPSYL